MSAISKHPCWTLHAVDLLGLWDWLICYIWIDISIHVYWHTFYNNNILLLYNLVHYNFDTGININCINGQTTGGMLFESDTTWEYNETTSDPQTTDPVTSAEGTSEKGDGGDGEGDGLPVGKLGGLCIFRLVRCVFKSYIKINLPRSMCVPIYPWIKQYSDLAYSIPIAYTCMYL